MTAPPTSRRAVAAPGLWRIRLAGLLLAATIVWYLPWLVTHMNPRALWLAVPFVLGSLILAANLLLSVINNWHRSSPPERLVALRAEPPVAVVIPTSHETPEQVATTARSVLGQKWPGHRLRLIVSDDAHSPEMEHMVAELAREFPTAAVRYHRPPSRGDPERDGDAKAGNLNSALRYVGHAWPDVDFIEVRDADDEVVDPAFLRRCIGQLEDDDRIAFVQTVKEARVSPGDPFDNNQPHFYRGAMLARHAANAVFPCGSGLVWRREALLDIGGFPTWNLVEDLQSGIEALRRGWRGVYLPVLGAIAQHAPEDIPVTYKQRGTWALDTMRLVFWRGLRGLGLRQRLHFLELGLFYLQSFAMLTFMAAPVIGFAFVVYPVEASVGQYSLHFWPFAASLELFLVALMAGQSYERLWRARQMWAGLAPVYAKACVLALVGGPHRKPTYEVTRKHDEFQWYWRETLVQTGFVLLLIGTLTYSLATTSLVDKFDVGSAYWAIFFVILVGGFVRKSWFGLDLRGRLARGTRLPLLQRYAPRPQWLATMRARRAR
ncbi:MAG TPA: glycosyltransferase [Thermoleophilaceae bacterium]|nr:glycosyltransferase [Thermoleophilaceae bacterium]